MKYAKPAVIKIARAKINLALHITGRRSDGYHLLDTLVVFAHISDEITVRSADQMSLKISGPYLSQLDAGRTNLVIKAAEALKHKLQKAGISTPGVAIGLDKQLPPASGIGGGSADAAATLLALKQLWGVDPALVDLDRIAIQLGADVPMCLRSIPQRATGIGEKLSAVQLPPLDLVLVNPGIHLSTPKVFSRLEPSFSAPLPQIDDVCGSAGLVRWLEKTDNDLQWSAIGLAPKISKVLRVLEGSDECLFARMTGSGATCFGLFPTRDAANQAAQQIAKNEPTWWCTATRTTQQ